MQKNNHNANSENQMQHLNRKGAKNAKKPEIFILESFSPE
jgi:hypothetical protein